ncbi:MAG: hypothetical protein JWR35_1019 [Marmoricola sp.]|jgi:hypothetical protein|nr:hypothetical protein [Marmoricola sp.]
MSAGLQGVVLEIEAHVAQSGWDQPAKLFALVETADLVVREPALAEMLGIDPASAKGLTPIEQDPVPADRSIEEVLQEIVWPDEVAGCAAVLERLVLPPEADDEIPEDPDAAAEYAANHPERQEVRIVAAVIRGGESFCALRLRSHDEDASVMGGPDVVPGLLELLHATLDPDASGDFAHHE